jgi:hypothetical protein
VGRLRRPTNSGFIFGTFLNRTALQQLLIKSATEMVTGRNGFYILVCIDIKTNDFLKHLI